MLVLTRRTNQSIVIGAGHVTVTVLEVRGDQVRLGINAPREVQVHREEVWAEIRQENQRAADAGDVDLTSLPKPPTG